MAPVDRGLAICDLSLSRDFARDRILLAFLSLADLIFWLAVACCLVAQVAIVRAALTAPARRAEGGADVPRPRRPIEIAWTVIPAIALALVLVATWHAIHRHATGERPPITLERAPSRNAP